MGEIKKSSNRIAKLRKEKGLTLQQVADAIGVGNNTISRYENGKREPNLATWLKLANFFGVSVSYITGASDEPSKNSGRLKSVRNDKGLSLEQMADAYNKEADGIPTFDNKDKEKHINAETIKDIENGNYQPNQHEWQLLARALNVPEFYLSGRSNDKVGWQEWADATGYSVEQLQHEVQRLIDTNRLDKSLDIQHQIGYAVKSLDLHAPTTTSGVINEIQSKLIELRGYINDAFLEAKKTPISPGSKLQVIKPGDVHVKKDMDEEAYNKLIDIVNQARYDIEKIHPKK